MNLDPRTVPTNLSHGIVRAARPFAGALVGLLIASLVIGLVVLVVQTYGIARAIREAQVVNTSTNEAILSCTTPDGECTKKGQRATAEAVANIAEVSIIAAACADRPGPQDAVTIEACVRAEVEKRHPAE